MKKFEIGQVIYESGLFYKITGRTTKKVSFDVISHFGKFNEKLKYSKTATIKEWDDKEVFYIGSRTVEA